MLIDAVFYLVAFLLITSSFLVLFSSNIYRSAIFLAFSMLSFAGLYFLLSAEFIGVIQILVYVGAVSVLIALSVMLVRDIEKSTESNKYKITSNILIALIIILISSFFINYDWNSYSDNILNSSNCLFSQCANNPGILVSSTDWIGKLITADYIIAFQLTGLILLASLIGALALLRIRMGVNDAD